MALAKTLEEEQVKKLIETLKLIKTLGDTLNDVEFETVPWFSVWHGSRGGGRETNEHIGTGL